MASQRDDYVLRLIDELREFVTRLINLGDASRLDEALMAAVAAQEKLFARPAAQFTALPITEQLTLLRRGETPPTGRSKCLAYADILEEAGLVYRAKSREDFAAGAFALALCTSLFVALESPEGAAEAKPQIERLLGRVEPERLPPPVRGLLERFQAGR